MSSARGGLSPHRLRPDLDGAAGHAHGEWPAGSRPTWGSVTTMPIGSAASAWRRAPPSPLSPPCSRAMSRRSSRWRCPRDRASAGFPRLALRRAPGRRRRFGRHGGGAGPLCHALAATRAGRRGGGRWACGGAACRRRRWARDPGRRRGHRRGAEPADRDPVRAARAGRDVGPVPGGRRRGPRGCRRHEGRAILLPGPTHAGKSTLVAELVRRGAPYFSDEYALIDADGRVHPYPRPLLLRDGSGYDQPRLATELGGMVAHEPLPAGLIVGVRHAPDASPSLRLSARPTAYAPLAEHASSVRR